LRVIPPILQNQRNVVNDLLKGCRLIVRLRNATASTSGGKAAALAALLRAGAPVPDGFVVPFDAYRTWRDATSRTPEHSAPPPSVLDALATGLEALGDPPVAVRSSADGEDTAAASAAGQHESVLGVRGVGEVADAVRACWASLHSARAVAYRDASGRDQSADAPAMAVLVQRLVEAEVSGVMFTPADPDGTTRIEASWGLGPSVVGGTVTPDTFRVVADGSVARTVADKRTRLDRGGARLVTREVPAADRTRATLDDATALRLATLGQEVATLLGGPQDVEWAVAGGQVWILQSRPVTAAPPPDRPGARTAASTVLTGTPGSRGTATGTARIVRGPGDFARVRPGDVLVCPWTDPAWTPLLRVVSGIVTETGGVLSHAAIVAREQRIPAVLGVPGATTLLPDGALVTLDGAAGTVTPTST
jgi:pyruvate,water dikinase